MMISAERANAKASAHVISNHATPRHNNPVSFNRVQFGHGDGDHFHPHDPVVEYGKSNPFFKPLVSAFLSTGNKPEQLARFAEQWILNPEIDGANNLKSLHLLMRPKSLHKSLNQLSMFKRPGGFRLGIIKTTENICKFWPLKGFKKSVHKTWHAQADAVEGKLLKDLVQNRMLPMLHFNILANPKADSYIRAEAAKLLVWDLIAQYQPDTDHYPVNLHPEFKGFKLPDEQYDTKRWGRKLYDALSHLVTYETQVAKDPKAQLELKKILSNFEYAWPHDAYAEAQRAKAKAEAEAAKAKEAATGHTHSHKHDHDHDHGHSHNHSHKPHSHGHSHSHSHDHDHDHDHDHGHGHSHSHDHQHPAPKTDTPKAAAPAATAGHGHSHDHSKVTTIHRDAGWDAPKSIAPELAEKLLVLPMSQPIRPLIQGWKQSGHPENWADQLFQKLAEAK